MIKFKLYFDKDKETAWLNEMSSNGWSMNGFFAGFYRFEPCEKGKYTYQIDFGNKLFSVSDDYKSSWRKPILRSFRHGDSGYFSVN